MNGKICKWNLGPLSPCQYNLVKTFSPLEWNCIEVAFVLLTQLPQGLNLSTSKFFIRHGIVIRRCLLLLSYGGAND